MALSGNFTTNSISEYGLTTSFTFSWTATQSVANNTSTVSWTVKTNQSPSGSGYTRGVYKTSVVVNGTTYGNSNHFQVSDGTTVLSGSTTVAHGSDGTKTFSANISISVGSTTVTNTGSGSWTLNSIPRYSSISVANTVTMGTKTTVTVTQQASTFYSILYARTSTSGSWSEVGRKGGATSLSYDWTPPNTATSVTTSDRTTYQLRVVTYLNNSYSGTSLETTPYTNVTALVPSSNVPTVSMTLADTIAKPTGWGYIIGFSKLKATTAFTGSAGSTKKSTSVTFGSETAQTSTTATTFTQSGTVSSASFNVKAVVTDSRNRTGQTSQNISAISYTVPSVKIQFTRCNADGTANPQGTNALVRAQWTVTNVATNLNEAVIYVGTGTSTSISTNKVTYNIGTITSSNAKVTTWTTIGKIKDTLSITSDYTYTVRITDKFKDTYIQGTVTKSSVALSAWSNGTDNGVTVGRMATGTGFNVYDMNSYMSGTLTVNSTLDVAGRGHIRGGLELYGQDSSTNGGYIDFHYANSSSDYTTRIIEGNGQLQFNSNVDRNYYFIVKNLVSEYNTYIQYRTQSNGQLYWGIHGSSTRASNQTKAWLVNGDRSGTAHTIINIYDDDSYNFFNGGLYVNRLTSGDFNSLLPTTNRFTVYNTSTGLTNNPGYWGNVISIKGSDTNDGTQFFQAITADKVFIRKQQSGTWQRWRQLPVIANQGTVVLTFSNGQCSWDISSLGLSAKPNNIILTMQSHDGFVRYNYDSSTATTAVLRAYYVNGTAVAPLSTSVRVGYIILMN